MDLVQALKDCKERMVEKSLAFMHIIHISTSTYDIVVAGHISVATKGRRAVVKMFRQSLAQKASTKQY